MYCPVIRTTALNTFPPNTHCANNKFPTYWYRIQCYECKGWSLRQYFPLHLKVLQYPWARSEVSYRISYRFVFTNTNWSATTYETSMKLPSYLSKHLHTSLYVIEWTNVPKSHIDKKRWQTDRITISGIQREGVVHNLSNTQRQKHARDDFTAPTTIQPNSTRITWRMVGESWIPLVPIPHGISYHMRH